MSKDRFKFRVWNTLINAYEEDGFLLDVRKGKVAGQNTDIYILEQCTGLKDMNGQLIYEGDVITNACEGEELEEYDIRFVKWCKAYSGELFCSVHKDGEPSDFYGGIPLLEYTRVIGNIHTWEQK